MEKRVWIAIALSALVLFLYPIILSKFRPKPAANKEVPAKEFVKEGGEGGPAAPRLGPAKAAQLIKEEFVTVETPLYRAVFTTLGGGVKKFELKKYKVQKDAGSKGVDLGLGLLRDSSFKTIIEKDGVQEIVVFKPSAEYLSVSENDTAELGFIGRASNGLIVTKTYIFTGSGYFIDIGLKIESLKTAAKGKAIVALAASVAGKDATGYHTGPIIKTKDKLLRQNVKEAEKTGTGHIAWLGIEDKYFFSAIIPKPEAEVNWQTEVQSASSSKALVEIPFDLKAGGSAVSSYAAFIGPKEYDLLLKYKAGFEEVIEFGYFSFMARPMLVVLNFFERYLKNYGLAIMALTFIIKVIFYPLTSYGMKSMKEMQKVQPQLAAIKERYKDDKEKLNKELMELYKKYKINPVSGCLPMLLQVPVFIALYEVLYVAIELRHAPFFLWIADLSAKDPYYVTPLIMGATMFVQQKMTPTSVDPAQQKIMLLMPAVFTVMFLKFPAGLVIYWLVNNALTIAQQYYSQRTVKA
ncbi:MAG: membrane protein insertase YidC [Deltaproteobacteria bacterium]|nr:membrane protein insertase YidC [Deltaproteobacteria bacterium]